MLGLIGPHNNIVSSYGLALLNGTPTSLLSFESTDALQQFQMFNSKGSTLQTVISFVHGIAKGMSHLHKTGILHNPIVPVNVCLKYETVTVTLLHSDTARFLNFFSWKLR